MFFLYFRYTTWKFFLDLVSKYVKEGKNEYH